jgi:hypothetical protein
MTTDRLGSHVHQVAGWKPGVPLNIAERGERAWLALYAPGLPFGDRERWVSMCRAFNETAAAERDRFSWLGGIYAAIPFPNVDEALAEIRRATDDLALDGVCLFPVVGSRLLDEADALPVLRELSSRKLTVLVHPVDAEGSPVLNARYLDSVLFIARMMYNDRLKECPGIRFVLAHTAGIVPYLGENLGMLQYMQAEKNNIGKFLWDYMVKKRLEGDIFLRSLWVDAGDSPDSERIRWQESYFEAEHVLV